MNIDKELRIFFKNNRFFLNLLLLLGIIFTLFSFYTDIKNTLQDGSMDLRNRVVGARIYKHTHKNPYTFMWNLNTPEKYVDPFDFLKDFKANRLTVTPPVLWLHSLFCDLPYKTQQFIWNISMWILLIFSLILLTKGISLVRKKIIFIIALFMVFSAYFMRLHIDKGQIYILYLFLFSISYYFSNKRLTVMSGLFLGMLIAMRPTAILILLPIFWVKKYKIVFFSTIFLLFFMFIPTIGHGLKIYKQYYNAMEQHGLLHLSKIPINSEYYPKKKIIDGVKNLIKDGDFPFRDSSVQFLVRKYFHKDLYPKFLMILFFVFVLLPVFFYFYKYRYQNSDNDDDMLFLVAFTLFFASDFFLPATRMSYNNVLWLYPIVMILKNIDNINRYFIVLLLMFIAFIFNLLYYVTDNFILLSDYFFLIFVIISVCILLKNPTKKNENTNLI